MADKNREDKLEKTPAMVLVLLSFLFPGGGQIANGQTLKGFLFAAVSVLLLFPFFYFLAGAGFLLYNDLSRGIRPHFEGELLSDLKALGIVLLLGLLLSAISAAEAVMSAKKSDK